MTDFNPISAFIAVVREGSFGAAARRLRMEKSTLSRRVTALEQSLGFPLLRRTTRKMVLTPEGKNFFAAVDSAWGTIESATQSLKRDHNAKTPQQITGTVRITAPVVLGQTLLIKPLAEFKTAYPGIHLEVLIDDRVLDVTSERIDIAIRGGPIHLSSAKARRLGFTHFRLFASPDFLSRHNRFTHPQQLRQVTCLTYVPDGEPYPWELVNDHESKDRCRIKPTEDFRINHLGMIKEVCKAGVGVALIPTLLVQDEILSGELVPVLKDWGAERSAYALVIPHSQVISEAVKVCAKFLGDKLLEQKLP